jgi:hypothetical protein
LLQIQTRIRAQRLRQQQRQKIAQQKQQQKCNGRIELIFHLAKKKFNLFK